MKAPIRDRLLAAAQTVFRIHGFEDITVQMIADEADANISAANYHYGSKADLHVEYVARYLEESVGRMPMLEDRPDAPKEQLARDSSGGSSPGTHRIHSSVISRGMSFISDPCC